MTWRIQGRGFRKCWLSNPDIQQGIPRVTFSANSQTGCHQLQLHCRESTGITRYYHYYRYYHYHPENTGHIHHTAFCAKVIEWQYIPSVYEFKIFLSLNRQKKKVCDAGDILCKSYNINECTSCDVLPPFAEVK